LMCLQVDFPQQFTKFYGGAETLLRTASSGPYLATPGEPVRSSFRGELSLGAFRAAPLASLLWTPHLA